VNTVVMLCLGVVTGASITFFGEEAAAVPVVGSVPGWTLGTAGLLVAAGIYYWTGGSSCDCAGDCGDSCSV